MKWNIEKVTVVRHRGLSLLLLCLYIVFTLGGTAVATANGEGNTIPTAKIPTVLQEKGTYIVAYSEDYSPFSYTDSSGKVAGMAIDIMNYIAQLAGITVNYISVDESERYDVDVDINLSILAEDQLVDVNVRSIAYTDLQMMAVSDSEALNPRDATIGHLSYAYLGDDVIEESFAGCYAYTYFSYAEMAQDYLSGNLDYMLVTSLVASQMLETTYQVDTYVIPTNVNLDFYMNYSDTMSQAEVAEFDSIIRSLNSDYIYSLMLSSVISAANTEITLAKIFESYAVPILIIALLLIVFVAGLLLRANYSKRMALEKSMNIDDVTGMMTERKFMQVVDELLKTAQAGEYFIITIDIDHFKFINEIYGYDIGTRVIVLFGETLQQIFPKDTIIARFFADNFVILYHAQDTEFHRQSTATYEDYISGAVGDLLGENYRLTTSSGIYSVDDPTLPLSYMVDCANVARLRGKTDYGISKMEFTKQLEERIRQKNEIVRAMEFAVKNKEFRVHYQPKISLKTGKLVGAEALVRWITPDGQRRYPDEFIPLFESNGFICKVDLFVLEEVCDFLRRYPAIPKISVNFSGVTMLHEELIARVNDIIRTYGTDPGRLEIEITESAVVQNFEPIVKKTAQLKEMGFTISMDDFGAGISSLNRLKDLDIDVLKIDRGFLGEAKLGTRSVSIIQHIVGMSQELGIHTIAEGVEHSEQEALLKSLGCDMVQGYYYARPLAEKDYLEFCQSYTL